MRNSLIDTNELATKGNYIINSSLYNLDRLKFINMITPDMLYEYEVLEDTPLPLLSLQVYGDSSFWDIILFVNGAEFDILPMSNKYIYSEIDRMKKKLYDIYKHNTTSTDQQMEQLAFDLLNKKNADKRKIKLVKKEYLGMLTGKYMERNNTDV